MKLTDQEKALLKKVLDDGFDAYYAYNDDPLDYVYRSMERKLGLEVAEDELNKVVLGLSQETYEAIKREITGARDTTMDWVTHFEREEHRYLGEPEGAAYLEAKEDVKRLNKYLEELG
jgi:hypothetical protein